MEQINDTLFARWYGDSSEPKTEVLGVSPIHYCIQLNYIPEFGSIRITGFSEVFEGDTIRDKNYRVDYGDGIIWFNPSQKNKSMTIDYVAIGFKTISAKRIMMNDGEYIEENTLQHLVDLNAQAVATVNNIQNNLDNILNSAQKYADQTKLDLDQYSDDTKNKMAQAYNKLYAQMDNYVGEILKYKTQAISEMTVTLNQYKQEADHANEEMSKAIIDFSAVAEKNIAKLDKALNDAMLEIQKLITTINETSNNIIRNLNAYKESQQKKMDESVNEVKKAETNAKARMEGMIDNLQGYLLERKKVLDNIVEEARQTQADLEHIFKVQQLIWEGQFNDAQVERMNEFLLSQTAKQNTFDRSEANRATDFASASADQQKEFEEAEAEREKIFDTMKELAYDENAILANQALSNTKIDTVEMDEQILELTRDENGRITGSIGGDRIHFYSNVVNEDGTTAKQKIAEHLVVGRQSTYKGTEEPIDVEKIWYDLSDEDCKDLQLPSDYNLGQFQDAVNQIRDEVSTIQSAMKLEDVFSGTFYGEESTSDNVDEELQTVKYVRIKTGSNINLRQLKEGELAYCPDTGRLYIGVRQSAVSTLVRNEVIGGTSSGDGGSSSGNLTGEHLELNGRDGKKYRIYIDEDGELKQRLVEFLDAEAPDASTAGVGARYTGLLINRYYGGGAKDNGKAPISHSFIELYNNNANGQTMNLKGLCLYYKNIDDGVWRRFELKGYVPYQHSFLVRCGRVNSKANSSCRYEITRFDQSWEQELSFTSGMVYLGVDYGQLTISNPYNLADGTTLNSYIDILAGACETEERSLTAVEYTKTKAPAYRRLLSQDCGIQRVDFNDTGSTYKDVEQVNYRTCDMDIYRPRCVEDGAWDLYYNKTKLNPNIPNLLNIQYGKEWHTRTFTWQSKVMARGYLRYRKVGESKWNYKNTNTEIVYHIDQDCTIHRVILRNLEEGIYEYQAGDEGYWGDVSTFEVKSYQTSNGVYDKTKHLKFLHVTDQQALYENDYEAWRWSAQFIEDNEDPNDYDFVINTGDISQSGNRSFEWRCYYKFPRFLKEKCHMLVCGNNDLFEKIYSNCFKYYDATENDFDGDIYKPNFGNHDVIQGVSPYGGYASSHSFDLGYCHFVVVNSNMTASVEDPDIWVKQMNWVRQDVQAARMRPNPPRWFIMVAHHGAFTVCRMKDVQQMIPFVEDIGFHVVICGHHHTYSRSTPIRMNIREQVEAITGHDLYEVYDGCGQAITKAVYSIGYIETFANKAGVHVVPKGVTYDQTTENGTNEDGSQGVVSNGNVGSRQAYVNDEIGTMWVMGQASGAKLKSNKDLEKTPTPWYYGWCNYTDEGGYTNNPHPYKPNYLMWDISWDSISVKSYVLNGIVDYDTYLADAVMKRPDQIDYRDINKELIDEFTIKWRNIPQTEVTSISEEE